VQTPAGGRAAISVSLAVALAATIVTLAAGAALKAPCASGYWNDGRQYRLLCYSDIVPLYGTEHLQGNRIPYVDACPADSTCDEYPVLTMYFMRATAWVARAFSDSFTAFFVVNALALAGLALSVTWALYEMVGARALYFALAPTLAIYAFMNWDLLTVALATFGTLAYLRRRDGTSGWLLGLGAAAKAYPALLVVPFATGRVGESRTRDAGRLVLYAAGAWAVVNLPFALGWSHSWLTFFRFNAARGADWDSLWFAACQRIEGGQSCSWSPRLLNLVSLALFLALAFGVWWWRRSIRPGFAAWTFGFPVIALFLLTDKVYSPQYGLWLLPWFALALPSLPLFVAFEAADVAVFVTRFSWFGRLSHDLGQSEFAGYHGAPLGAFEIAIVVRAVVLVICVVAWVLRDDGPLPAMAADVPGAEARDAAARRAA
jgi:uncharacterized membrane protein